MADLMSPCDGDVLVHCFLPSGSRLELQMYFKAGEDARTVVSRELAIAGLAQAHLPQIITALKDVFLGNRREKACAERVGRRVKCGSREKQGRWRVYSQQFASHAGLNNLRALYSEAHTLSLQLAKEREALVQQFPPDQVASYEERLTQEKAETALAAREAALIESFWIGVEKDQPNSSVFPPAACISKAEFEQTLTISLGTLRKRQVKVTVLLREDMFLEQLRSDAVASEYACLQHSENVYTTEMTAICVPVSVQDGCLSALPELIRKCEETPELHFPPIRQQMTSTSPPSTSNSLVFTRHSNLGQARGVFHLQHYTAFRLLLPYCDRNYVACLVVPVCEWTAEDPQITANLLNLLKSALMDCGEGDLRTVVLVLDTEVEDCKAMIGTLEALFAEELLPERHKIAI